MYQTIFSMLFASSIIFGLLNFKSAHAQEAVNNFELGLISGVHSTLKLLGTVRHFKEYDAMFEAWACRSVKIEELVQQLDSVEQKLQDPKLKLRIQRLKLVLQSDLSSKYLPTDRAQALAVQSQTVNDGAELLKDLSDLTITNRTNYDAGRAQGLIVTAAVVAKFRSLVFQRVTATDIAQNHMVLSDMKDAFLDQLKEFGKSYADDPIILRIDNAMNMLKTEAFNGEFSKDEWLWKYRDMVKHIRDAVEHVAPIAEELSRKIQAPSCSELALSQLVEQTKKLK